MPRVLAIVSALMLLAAVAVGVSSLGPTKKSARYRAAAVVGTQIAFASDDPSLAPLFDVPRLDKIALDGSGASWGERGLRVDLLANTLGKIQPKNDVDAHFRLGWNEQGLLVLVTVHDDIAVEDVNPANGDSVELFLSPQVGEKSRLRVAIGPGIDPKHPKLRTRVFDLRTDPVLRKSPARVSAARTKVEGGYVIEALIPWSNLGIQPRLGREVGFQLQVNDSDSVDQVSHLVWFPSLGASRDPTKMQRLRLVSAPGPAVRVAAYGDYPRFHRTRVTVLADASLAGKNVEVARWLAKKPDETPPPADDNEDEDAVPAAARQGPSPANAYQTLVTGKLDADFVRPECASANLSLPMPARGRPYGVLDVLVDGKRVGVVDLPDPGMTASWIMPYQEFVFKPCVFSTRAFPEGDFEDPSYVEDLVGSYESKVTFYDTDGNPATTAEKPGRYGAVVEVRTEDGQTFKRYRTLFREPKDFSWRNTEIPFTVKLPKEMGITAGALKLQQQSVSTYFKELLRDSGVNRDSDTAVLLAGLFETKPGDQALLRNSPAAMDRAWWAGLKGKIHEPVYKHLVYLPQGYEADGGAAGSAAAGKRYPLVLFLHGKGERGDNLIQIKDSVLPSKLEYEPKFREQFPAILVAPQCPANEWWSTIELANLLDEVQSKYRVDPDRVYVTGMSMGGYGTWALAAAYPDRFAAIVPVCGGGDPGEAERLASLPIWVFHGNKDNVVPFNESQKMVNVLQPISAAIRFTAYPECGHDAWTETYANPDLYAWLFSRKRGARSTPPARAPQVAGASTPTTMPILRTTAAH